MTAEFLAELAKAKKVLITTHVRPDGDALGSVGAMALGLRQKGIAAEILLLSHLPTKYRFVFEEVGLEHHDAERGSGIPALSGYDTVLIADTGTFSQLPGLEVTLKAFEAGGGRVLVIDHHKTQEPWGTMRLVDTAVASATELVCRTLKAWGVKIDKAIAGCVYVGLVSDTGWFQFSNTGPATLRMAAELMEVEGGGVDPDKIYQRLYLSEREPRLRLQNRALSSLEVLAEGRVAIMHLTKKDFEETGAGVPDTEAAVNVPLAIQSVEMSILATEPPEGGPIRISCRSKGGVDVSKFAEGFGGGGHARAAGLKLALPLGEALEKLRTAATGAVEAGKK